MPDKINDFLNATTVFTYGGASLAVMVVSNTVRTLVKIDSPWVPFVISVLIAFGGTYYVQPAPKGIDWFLSFINACILFTSSAGIQGGIIHAATKQPAGSGNVPFAARKVSWLSPWFK